MNGVRERAKEVRVAPRIAALLVLLTIPSTCASPKSADANAADVKAELNELIRRSPTLKACTATYRATGSYDATIRIHFSAPDRARIDSSEIKDGHREESSSWVIKDRIVSRSERGEERQCADVRFADAFEDDRKIIDAALEHAFPSASGGASRMHLGDGVFLALWIKTDAKAPEHGSLDLWAGWQRRRDYVFQWQTLMSALPVLRDDGERIIGADPEARLEVVLAKSNGFIERITSAAETIELEAWTPSADDADFLVPPPLPGAKDFSDEYRKGFIAAFDHLMNESIALDALEARQRDSIADEEFTTKLASVYDVANGSLLRVPLADLRAILKKASDEAVSWYRRQRAASAADPDLRGIADQWIAKQRLAVIEMIGKASEVALEPDPPLHLPAARSDPHSAELIAEARRRSLAATLERDVKQPALAYFDEQVLAVQSKQ